MAQYKLIKPAYINGVHYAAEFGDPAYPTFPDDLVPSRTWEPMDEAALKALNAADAEYIKGREADAALLAATNPAAAQAARAEVEKLKKRKRVIVGQEAPAAPAKPVNTNVEMNEQRRTVVGRTSDRSPV